MNDKNGTTRMNDTDTKEKRERKHKIKMNQYHHIISPHPPGVRKSISLRVIEIAPGAHSGYVANTSSLEKLENSALGGLVCVGGGVGLNTRHRTHDNMTYDNMTYDNMTHCMTYRSENLVIVLERLNDDPDADAADCAKANPNPP